MPKSLGVYIRLSLQGEDDESLKRQREQGANWAKSHDLTPIIYEEPKGHRSGYSEAKRPGWLRLKQDLTDGKLAGVWVADIARASRNVRAFLEFLDLINKSNALFVSQKESIDTNSAAGRMLLTVLSAFNEFYRSDISERQKRRVAYRKERGETVGKIPLGLHRNGSKKFEASDESYTAPDGTRRRYLDTVIAWFKLYTSTDIGVWDGARTLNNQGYRWRNEAKGKSRGKPMLIEAYHLTWVLRKQIQHYASCVEPALIRAVRRRRAERASHLQNGRKVKRGIPLLWKLLRCDTCGRGYHIHNRDNTVRLKSGEKKLYCYRNYMHRATSCPDSGYIYQASIDKQVLDRLALAWGNIPAAEKDKLAYDVAQPPAPTAPDEIEKAQRKLERLKRLFLDGLIDELEYSGQLKESKAELDALKHREESEDVRLEFGYVRAMLDDLPGFLSQLDPPRRNQLMRHLLLGVYVKDRKVTRLVPRPIYSPLLISSDVVQ